jgi:plasmid stabilization system protein ParE
MPLTFNRLVQNDLRGALNHYDDAAGPHLALRFYNEFEELLAAIQTNPKRFHGVPGYAHRRANFPSFPFHLIFRETADGGRVPVLRHHRRHPDFGMGRK